MKFTVSTGDFDSALKSVQNRARVSTMLPILKHVLVTAKESKVSVLGNDLDSSNLASVDAEIALPGSWAIPAEPLVRIAGSFPKAGHITVEFDGKSRDHVTVKSGRSRYVLPVLSPNDFPDALSAKGGFSVDVTAADLNQLFSRNSGVHDKARPYLNGAFLHEEAGKLVSVTTDGHSLLRFASSIDAASFTGVIVPHASMQEIVKIGAGKLSVTDRTIEIVNGSRSYCSKLVDGTYPDYRRVIPALNADHVIVDRQTIIESLARLDSIGAFSECGTIDISFADGEISLTLDGIANGSEIFECETVGNAGFFCLQTRNLLDACNTLTGEKLDIFVKDEGSPIRIVDLSEPETICIEMPCLSKRGAAKAAA